MSSSGSGKLQIIKDPNTTDNVAEVDLAHGDAMNPTVDVKYKAVNSSNPLTYVNVSMGQATTVTQQDPGVASVNNMVAGTLVAGNISQASTTGGYMVDSGIAASSLVTSSSAAGPIQSIAVTMNTAAVTGAFATPVQLIAAPGAGKVILVQEAAVYTASTGNTAYASGGVGILQYGNTANGAGTNAMGSTIAAANITTATSKVLAGLLPSTTALASVSNLGIFFSNQTGAFTNGTGTNVTIFLTYQVIPATV